MPFNKLTELRKEFKKILKSLNCYLKKKFRAKYVFSDFPIVT